MNDEASEDASIQTSMLDAVCEGLAAAFIVYDKNDLMIFASRQVLTYFPVSPQFLRPGTRLRDFLNAVYDSGIRPVLDADRGRTNPISREDWISERIASHWRERSDVIERHGADRWTRFVKRRLPSGYGICVITDVSEHKKREEQWRADLERVQLTEEILDTLPFPVFVKDRNLTYVAVNKAYCALRAVAADALLGRTLQDALVADIATRYEAVDRHVLETGMQATVPEKLIRPDGGEMEVVTRKQRIGKPGRYFLVTTIEDTSELGLVDGQIRGETGSRMTPSFSADDASIGIVDLALRAGPSETILPDRFAGRKVLLVTADISAEASATKTFARLNLDSCSVRSASEQEAFLDVASSVGIRLDLIIIDTQMDLDCLEIAERHGIDVLTLDGFQLSSELTYLLVKHFNRRKSAGPAGATGSSAADWDIAIDVEGRRDAGNVQVLVAEDNEVNQIVFSQILEGMGYSYRIATDGLEAVRLWEEEKPQVVLMDVTLPGQNGFEAARRIRQLELSSGRRTPIIGVLAQAFDHDRSQCVAAGMDDVIMKPISPDILEAVFQKFIGERAESFTG